MVYPYSAFVYSHSGYLCFHGGFICYVIVEVGGGEAAVLSIIVVLGRLSFYILVLLPEAKPF